MAEGRNTGIPAILRSLKDNGSPKPIFKTDAARTYFTVTFQINKEFLEFLSLTLTFA
jgi:ATP-dependent DNA helicase RecG